jgi:hypothetical protein
MTLRRALATSAAAHAVAVLSLTLSSLAERIVAAGRNCISFAGRAIGNFCNQHLR